MRRRTAIRPKTIAEIWNSPEVTRDVAIAATIIGHDTKCGLANAIECAAMLSKVQLPQCKRQPSLLHAPDPSVRRQTAKVPRYARCISTARMRPCQVKCHAARYNRAEYWALSVTCRFVRCEARYADPSAIIKYGSSSGARSSR